MTINQVAVLGAGVMGSQIAAQCANAGLEVLLLDIVPPEASSRNTIAATAVSRMLKADPAPFMTKAAARRIEVGNLEDDFTRLAGADWILEAVVERLDVKHALYERIAEVAKPEAVLTSNTSTLPRAELMKSMAPALAKRFLISHFFNPPRYMRLLELVAGDEVEPELVAAFTDFCDRRLGKTVVEAKDTPGFIANRIGSFWIQAAITAALDLGLSVEEADAVMGRPFGFPKTGAFGLIDLVGLDLIPYVDQSLAKALPADDGYNRVRRDWPLLGRLIEQGYTGRKGKGGFYRLNRAEGGRVKEAIDLETGDFAPAKKPALASLEAVKHGGPAALLQGQDRGGEYARRVLGQTLAYAAAIAPEIAHDCASIDAAMRLGYNWKKGPFELIDQLGAENFAKMCAEAGQPVPPMLEAAASAEGFYRVDDGTLQHLAFDGGYTPVIRPEGVTLLADLKRRSKPLKKNGSASLWDLGDGVFCFEVHTKLNTIDTAVLELLNDTIGITASSGKALVIHNEGSNFSAGANIGLALFAANVGLWQQVDEMVAKGQAIYRAMKYAKFPVVAAPSGMALGGGCELVMSADAVVAHAETYIGLVETGVGLVPAWGGCAELLSRMASDPRRPKGPMAGPAQAFQTIGMASVAKSAFEAKEMGFLAGTDEIVFNRDRVLAAAKVKALSMVDGYAPPERPSFTLPGATGRSALQLAVHDLDLKGQITPHDHKVVEQLGLVLTGGKTADMTAPLRESEVLKLERQAFMNLIRTEPTLERMQHTLETGKPLRN
ncbi:MAG: 3-hydroxyacyl-CoA dehydrogenase NAD-binding domain-containing protein [Geminicoccaceae bacterium]